jgi:outer membrane protein assembly factor BamB
LDRVTWTQKWMYESTQKWTPKLELDDAQLYALSRNGYMSAFDLVTGKKNWSKKPFSEIHEVKVRWGKSTDPERLYSNIFMSFFIFKNHIMISQPNQYVNLNKNGILFNWGLSQCSKCW